MNIYIDESGSMTHNINKDEFFIITLLLVENQNILKNIYNRFIRKYYDDLKNISCENKMFDKNEKFLELKGSSFNPDMKRKFINYFCKNNHFKFLYIKVDNSKAYSNFYKNKARAFNYIVKLALEHLNNRGVLTDRCWSICVDNRNIKTGTKHQLKEFLSTELITGKDIVDEIHVEYFDSCNNKLIQLADVFSNLLYSNIKTEGNYNEEIEFLQDNGYLIGFFKFPL